MAKIFFNDKQSGDSLTATNVNDIKAAINTNIDQLNADVSSLHLQDASSGGGGSSSTAESLSNGTVSGYYDSNNQWRYNHHFIPASNANFDLGSAEYKIRHLYLSDNSLWVGEDNKLTIKSDGDLGIMQRDKDVVPQYIQDLLTAQNTNISDALLTPNSLYGESELTFSHYLNYARQFNPDVTIEDIYPAPGQEGYNAADWYIDKSIVPSNRVPFIHSIDLFENGINIIKVNLNDSNKFFANISDSTSNNIEIQCMTDKPLEEGYSFEIFIKGFETLSNNPNVRFAWAKKGLPAEVIDVHLEYNYDNTTERTSSSYGIIKAKIISLPSDSSTTIEIIENELTGTEPTAYNANGDKFYAPGIDNYNLYKIPGDQNTYIYAYNNNGVVSFTVLGGESIIDINPDNITVNSTNVDGYVTSFTYAPATSTAISEIDYLSNYINTSSNKNW